MIILVTMITAWTDHTVWTHLHVDVPLEASFSGSILLFKADEVEAPQQKITVEISASFWGKWMWERSSRNNDSQLNQRKTWDLSEIRFNSTVAAQNRHCSRKYKWVRNRVKMKTYGLSRTLQHSKIKTLNLRENTLQTRGIICPCSRMIPPKTVESRNKTSTLILTL